MNGTYYVLRFFLNIFSAYISFFRSCVRKMKRMQELLRLLRAEALLAYMLACLQSNEAEHEAMTKSFGTFLVLGSLI